MLSILLLVSLCLVQDHPDRLTSEEGKQLSTMLEEVLKAKPGEYAVSLADPALKRQFDLASRVEQLGILKINKAMREKKYAFDGDFVGYYISRFQKLYDEKTRKAWLLAYAAENRTEKAFFEKLLGRTGLKDDKRSTIILSFYHLLYPAERAFYMEIVEIVYKNGLADFSPLPKRAKDWVAERNELFP